MNPGNKKKVNCPDRVQSKRSQQLSKNKIIIYLYTLWILLLFYICWNSVWLDFKEAASHVYNTIYFNMRKSTIEFNINTLWFQYKYARFQYKYSWFQYKYYWFQYKYSWFQYEEKLSYFNINYNNNCLKSNIQ